MNILITGSTGFVGTHLTQHLKSKHNLTPITRQNFPSITANTDWSAPLHNIDTVIHLAARVHIMHDADNDPLQSYREANTHSTLNLAQQAANAGVKRFIFLSSIKVNGEGTDTPYTEQHSPQPQDPYALSKWEAEQGLLTLAQETSLDVVILRPPLIYGAGVKANFLRMLQWLDKGIPLPLGSIQNQRSLLYIDNLMSAIECCIDHPKAIQNTFLIADDEKLSTSELLRQLAVALNASSPIINFPATWLKHTLTLLGKQQEAERLLGSLTIDNQHIKQALNWSPPFSAQQGLTLTAQSYRSS